MTKLDGNAERRGEHPVGDKNRTGPEIDLGRRRFAWLTVGTASSMTLMSRSALGGMTDLECVSQGSPSALESFRLQGKEICAAKSAAQWLETANADWPQGLKKNKQFSLACVRAPAFDGRLKHVLGRKGASKAKWVVPDAWTTLSNGLFFEVQKSVRNQYIRALRDCGVQCVCSMLNSKTFADYANGTLPADMIEFYLAEAWQVFEVPADVSACEQQVRHCRERLVDLTINLAVHNG